MLIHEQQVNQTSHGDLLVMQEAQIIILYLLYKAAGWTSRDFGQEVAQ